MKLAIFLLLFISIGVGGYAAFSMSQWIHQPKPYVGKKPSKPAKVKAEAIAKEANKTEPSAPPPKEGEGSSKEGEGEKSHEGASSTDPVDSVANHLNLEEIVVNPPCRTPTKKVHILDMQLDLLLFDTKDRGFLESHVAVINDQVIRTVESEYYEDMSSLGGKLYLKEQMVSHLNNLFDRPIIEDIHFNTFFLQ